MTVFECLLHSLSLKGDIFRNGNFHKATFYNPPSLERIDLRDERGFELEAVPASQAVVGRGRLVKARFIGGLARQGRGKPLFAKSPGAERRRGNRSKKPKEVVGVLLPACWLLGGCGTHVSR